MLVAEPGQVQGIGPPFWKQSEDAVPYRLGGSSRELLVCDCLEQRRKGLTGAPRRQLHHADPIDPLGESGILGAKVMDGAGVHAASLMQSVGLGSHLSRRRLPTAPQFLRAAG